MNERVKNGFYIIADWGLNLSIALTIIVMGLSIWLVIGTCFIYKDFWIRAPQPPELVQPNPEMMKILDDLEKKDGKN